MKQIVCDECGKTWNDWEETSQIIFSKLAKDKTYYKIKTSLITNQDLCLQCYRKVLAEGIANENA